ncbi:MAG: carbohydrate ABC transporter permease [Ruminococcus sp.]|nr:carbohydrate ABC transporter permease [Ruminococcus sp.]HRR76139.1 carbohydrate ABC transporter permease [Ruminococcus sp.]
MSGNMKSVYGQGKDNYMFKIRLKSTILFVWCIILTIICLVPIYILLINATREASEIAGGLSIVPGSHFMKNVETMRTDFKQQFRPLIGYRNSAIITISATFLSVFFSALTAYGIHVYDFKLKEISYTAILLVMMVPAQVTAAGFLNFMVKIHLTDSYIPLIVPAAAAPAIVFFMRSYMKSSFPLDIVEAARIDGCSEFRTFLTIAIPMMKPAIAVQAIFAFVAQWNNFYTPSMILLSNKMSQRTLPMMIANVQSMDTYKDYGVVYTCIAISIIPIIIAYILLSRFIIAGVALGGVKE